MTTSTNENDFVVRFHSIFFLIAAIVLGNCLQQTHFHSVKDIESSSSSGNENDACGNVGNTVLLLVASWHLAIFLRGLLEYPRILSYYQFLLPLSLWFVFPDWFLVAFARTLHFPRNGSFWMIGDAVSPCMVGMWSIPGFLVLHACYPNGKQQLTAVCYAKAAFASLVIFGAAENLLPFLWAPTKCVVNRVGWGEEGIAAYILPAETIFGPTMLYAYHTTKDSEHWYEPAIGAGMTMLVYTGAMAIGLLALEGSSHCIMT